MQVYADTFGAFSMILLNQKFFKILHIHLAQLQFSQALVDYLACLLVFKAIELFRQSAQLCQMCHSPLKILTLVLIISSQMM